MPRARHHRSIPLAAIALLALSSQLAGYGLHFAVEDHAISGATGELVHVDDCETHRPSSSPQAAIEAGCQEDHSDHACDVWVLLQQRLRTEAPQPHVAAPSLQRVIVALAPELRASGAALRFAPKTSPPALA